MGVRAQAQGHAQVVAGGERLGLAHAVAVGVVVKGRRPGGEHAVEIVEGVLVSSGADTWPSPTGSGTPMLLRAVAHGVVDVAHILPGVRLRAGETVEIVVL